MAPIWRVLLGTLDGVFAEPIREGRPQPSQWSPGLRVLAAAGSLVAIALALTAAFGGQLRRIGHLVANDEFITLPHWAVPVTLWLATFIVALVLSATCHAQPVLHPMLTLLFGSVIVALATISQGGVWLVPVLGMTVIGLLPVVLRRQGWRLWQFVLIWLIICLSVQVPVAWSKFADFGVDYRTLLTMSLTSTLLIAAWPAIAMAGYTATELAVTTGQWLAHSVRDLGSAFLNRWLLALVLLTGGWQLWTMVDGLLIDRSPSLDGWSILGSVLVVAGSAGLAWVAWSRLPGRDRRWAWATGAPGELAESWNPWALAFAAVLGIVLMPQSILMFTSQAIRYGGGSTQTADGFARAASWFSGDVTTPIVRWAAAVAMYLWSLRGTRRGNPRLSLLASVLVAMMTVSLIARLSDQQLPLTWRLELITGITSLAALVWLVMALATRRLHNGVLLAVWVVWLVAIVFGFRGFLDNPTSVLGGISAVGLLLGGLLWRLLTDGEYARGDSKAFPRSSRVLLVLANALLGTYALAMSALAGGQSGPINPSSVDQAGEYFLGGVLLTSVVMAPLLLPLYTRRRS